MLRYLPAVGLALMGATTVVAQTVIECDLDNKCPESAPCCSQYGQCGVGAYCLGGCDPLMSFSLDACAPAPVCQTKTMAMDSLDTMLDISEYMGDPETADWVTQGQPVKNNDHILLTMPPNSVGTVLASTTYMWYGNVKAKMKSGRGAGVVTAFIFFSDVKDELDYEWIGVDLSTAQTNYYFQGITDWTNSENITELSDTYNDWHEYEFRWTPEKCEWVVDGEVGRTLTKESTWNSTLNQYNYPQTPARVQFSIWPGGASSNAPGTINWAGGEIDWDSEDIQRDGYYYASLGEVTMECYETSSAPGTNNGVSYYYTDERATNDTVVDSDKPTVLGSLLATGLDMDKGADNDDDNDDSDNNDDSDDGDSDASPPATVPGNSGGNPGNEVDGDGDGEPDEPPAPVCTSGGFTQDCSQSEGSSSETNTSLGVKQPDHMLGVSTFAAVIAMAAMLWM